MKLTEKQIQENYNKAKEQEELKEQEHKKWFERQGFLTEKDRVFLVNELRDCQSNLSVAWHKYRDEKYKDERRQLEFTIDKEQRIASKIGDILIKNKFPL